jgi:hypothetical protein
MGKYTKKNHNDSATSMIDRILASHTNGHDQYKIIDIITFCEDPKFLNFLGQDPPITLWPMQKIVLKLFYRGTEGNEHLFLTEDELEILKNIVRNEELDYEPGSGGFEQVINKYHRGTEFTHLLLIMGRRSSKTMMVSIIAAYEAYKLCECPEGNPHKRYKIAPDKAIHIINAAVSEAQALDPLFAEIEARIFRSPYFLDKVNHESSIKGKLYILTDADKRENIRRVSKGIGTLMPGSIIMMSGHSNSGSLRGHATKCLLLDEFAHFVSTSGRSSGDEVYNALTPSMKQFGKHGKIVMLSDPRGKEGMFWKLFCLSQKRNQKPDGTVEYPHDDYLAIQLPTWCMNPNEEFNKIMLHKSERPKDPAAFLTSWGARFMGAEGSKFFDTLKIDACIDFRVQETKYGDPYQTYYIHLDPATTSHNYALVMVHSVTYMNDLRELKRKVFVDCVKFWKPDESGPIPIREVESAIKNLCARFRVASVTFDSFQSAQTIQNLRLAGINAFETPYRSDYMTKIYGELRNLVNDANLVLYPNQQLVGEMKELLHKLLNRGFKTFFDQKSEFPSDDCIDALAGAAFQATSNVIKQQLPKTKVVWTGGR